MIMTATWQGDMQFALVHQETGTTAWLAQRPGVGPDSTYGFANTNYGNAGSAVPFRAADLGVAIYNAPPTGALVDGIDNVSGLWRPQNPLSVFAGENASGTWRIMAQDCAGDFTGSLDGFILNLTPAGSTSSCYANCDHSTAVPFLNVQDFSCFLAKFASSDAYANCDNSTTPPVLNVQDFSCFLSKFATGCSAP